MINLILICFCLVIGYFLQRVKTLPKDAHLTLNQIILHVPLPAIALLNVPKLEWRSELFVLCLAPWLSFFFSFLFFNSLGKFFKWSSSVVGCLVITAGLGNTAFIGLPIIEALYGEEAIKLAVFLDQPGSFLIVSTVAIVLATYYSAGSVSKGELIKKMITFPPFISFVSAIILGLLGWRAEGDVKLLLERLAIILTPLALISVGLQLKLKELKLDLKFLLTGLFFKLFLTPLLIYSLYSFFNVSPLILKVSVIESAMAPMITASIVASSYGLHPRLAGSLLGFGVPLSFLTIYLWYSFLL